ncbi:MAG TPA: 3-oxoacyl-[acyl-carrier-protein] reductase [Candidatus Tectomicrobia bacterium]|nr:3-oxoacyl-[acyl-carrier-protein] reductase [Candidatus Tectomicrobia bacterium]
MELAGQVAVVTGGSRGIGRAIAQALAAMQAHVIINYVANHAAAEDTRGAIEAAGGKAAIRCFDVADAEGTQQAFNTILDECGRIDILVNNAGVTRDALMLRMKEEDWQRVLQINLSGMYHCSKAAIRAMIRQRRGRIINITSIIGIIGNAGQVNYAAAKAGAIGMTKALAREVASRGITVNAVAPGFIETEMTQGLSAQAKAELVRQIPLGRWGTPQDVADCVGFLVSSRASYITGQVLQVNGGLSM